VPAHSAATDVHNFAIGVAARPVRPMRPFGILRSSANSTPPRLPLVAPTPEARKEIEKPSRI
jgi:hypothetical protein